MAIKCCVSKFEVLSHSVVPPLGGGWWEVGERIEEDKGRVVEEGRDRRSMLHYTVHKAEMRVILHLCYLRIFVGTDWVSELRLYHLHVYVDSVVQHGGWGRKGGVRNSFIANFLWS